AEHLDADGAGLLVAGDDAGVAAVGLEGGAHLVEGLLHPASHVAYLLHPGPIIYERSDVSLPGGSRMVGLMEAVFSKGIA
ncbi:MAG: hypothetical protein AVDCRST_MAG12-2983, partial [uncultured Rubrobacteraceae bacterium]